MTALDVLRDVTENQKSPYLAIMIEETTDITNQEQVTIALQRIDNNFETFEKFSGLYMVSPSKLRSLRRSLKIPDQTKSVNAQLHGQCYDGCSTMSGTRTGVAKRISDKEPRAVFTHCYGHSLNLGYSGTVKKSKLLKQALETT